MSHFVLIVLSQKNISLYYNADTSSSYLQRYNILRSGISDYWTPLNSIEAENTSRQQNEENEEGFLQWAIEGIKTGVNQVVNTYNNLTDRTLYCKVESYLRSFFLDVYRNEDLVSLKANLPIGLLFCSEVSFDDRIRLLNLFKDEGYGNVASLDWNSTLVTSLKEQNRLSLPYTCVVENDGDDVSLGLYISQTAERLASCIVPGVGQDPRVGYGVKILWDSINARGLTLDTERPILTEIVKNFLDNDSKSLFNETIVLSNNKEYDAYLLKNDINSAALANDQLSVQMKSFFKKNEVEPAKVNIFFREFSSKNNLLESSLSQSFGSVAKVSDKLYADVLAHLWKEARLVDMDMDKICNQPTSNLEGVRTWVKNSDKLVAVIDNVENVISEADTMITPALDDLRKSEAVWLEHMKMADFKGAKLGLQLNVASNLDAIVGDLNVKKNELENIYSIVQSVASVDDAKGVVERYNKTFSRISGLLESVDKIKLFVSTKMEETNKYEDLFPSYKQKLDELRKTSVRSLQDKLIEQIKQLVPPGFELPVVQASKVSVKMSASVTTTGGFFSKKRKLNVVIDFGDTKVSYRCVLAFFTEPVTRVDRVLSFVDDLNESGEVLTGVVEKSYDLPFPEMPKCKKNLPLTIKLWPHEDEVTVGINNAFDGNTCNCKY
ncbi:MAG: hypothetical protein MJZ14_01990 [Paludibacteraceae bacterium]|nr:hypothetical protein [Paludibacteraceae bacterium]